MHPSLIKIQNMVVAGAWDTTCAYGTRVAFRFACAVDEIVDDFLFCVVRRHGSVAQAAWHGSTPDRHLHILDQKTLFDVHTD